MLRVLHRGLTIRGGREVYHGNGKRRKNVAVAFTATTVVGGGGGYDGRRDVRWPLCAGQHDMHRFGTVLDDDLGAQLGPAFGQHVENILRAGQDALHACLKEYLSNFQSEVLRTLFQFLKNVKKTNFDRHCPLDRRSRSCLSKRFLNTFINNF